MAKNNENGTIVVTETGVLDSGKSNDEKSILYSSVTNSNSTNTENEIILNTGNENTEKIKPIIVISIPTKNEKPLMDVFDNKDHGAMHFIVADNIYIAKNKLYKYLDKFKTRSVKNIIFDTHGGGAGWIYLDNKDNKNEIEINYFGYKHIANYNKYPDNIRQLILSLKMILEKIEENGNAIYLGCALARGETGIKFIKKIHSFNYKSNTFVSEAYNYGTVNENGEIYYKANGNYMPVIGWNEGPYEVLNGEGTNTETFKNQLGKGYKMMNARKGILIDLAITGSYNGNLLIDGEYGRFKY